MGADHSIPTYHHNPDTKSIQLKQPPVYVPTVNKSFIDWVTDYDCLIKNDDLFGLLPTTDELQNSNNVFALMQKIYDILSNIVRIQADYLYQKSNIAPNFQDFKFYISHNSKLNGMKKCGKNLRMLLCLEIQVQCQKEPITTNIKLMII